MDLQNLFILQKGIDDRLNKKWPLPKDSLLPEKILRLQVKISELANSTICFNFWSDNPSSKQSEVLTDFVEAIHYILSIGLDKNYTNIDLEITSLTADLTTQFLNLYIDINDFIVCPTKDNYVTMFENFLSVGNSLGLNKDEIEQAYLENNLLISKNNI
ncbi:dUTP diphosphatase [Clostridium sp. DL1XJH146]